MHTNDEIDLRSEPEGKSRMAHKLYHFHGLYDAIFGDSLVLNELLICNL